MAIVKFMPGGDVGEVAEIEQVKTADPFAQSTSKELQPQIAVEQWLKRATVQVTPDEASTELKLGHLKNPKIIAAYEAIESGAHLVELADLFKDSRPYAGLPGLAVAPALRAAEDIRCTVTPETTTFHSKRSPRRGWHLTLPVGGRLDSDDYSWQMRQTVVPLIPDSVRDFVSDNLKGKLLFWEPAKWVGGKNQRSALSKQEARQRRVASLMESMRNFDPALLEPVTGTLYRVVAAWDLTPMEIAALAG